MYLCHRSVGPQRITKSPIWLSSGISFAQQWETPLQSSVTLVSSASETRIQRYCDICDKWFTLEAQTKYCIVTLLQYVSQRILHFRNIFLWSGAMFLIRLNCIHLSQQITLHEPMLSWIGTSRSTLLRFVSVGISFQELRSSRPEWITPHEPSLKNSLFPSRKSYRGRVNKENCKVLGSLISEFRNRWHQEIDGNHWWYQEIDGNCRQVTWSPTRERNVKGPGSWGTNFGRIPACEVMCDSADGQVSRTDETKEDRRGCNEVLGNDQSEAHSGSSYPNGSAKSEVNLLDRQTTRGTSAEAVHCHSRIQETKYQYVRNCFSGQEPPRVKPIQWPTLTPIRASFVFFSVEEGRSKKSKGGDFSEVSWYSGGIALMPLPVRIKDFWDFLPLSCRGVHHLRSWFGGTFIQECFSKLLCWPIHSKSRMNDIGLDSWRHMVRDCWSNVIRRVFLDFNREACLQRVNLLQNLTVCFRVLYKRSALGQSLKRVLLSFWHLPQYSESPCRLSIVPSSDDAFDTPKQGISWKSQWDSG